MAPGFWPLASNFNASSLREPTAAPIRCDAALRRFGAAEELLQQAIVPQGVTNGVPEKAAALGAEVIRATRTTT